VLICIEGSQLRWFRHLHQDAFRTPPWGGFPQRKDASGETKDLLERLYLSAGLGTRMWQRRGKVWDLCLDCRPQISSRKWIHLCLWGQLYCNLKACKLLIVALNLLVCGVHERERTHFLTLMIPEDPSCRHLFHSSLSGLFFSWQMVDYFRKNPVCVLEKSCHIAAFAFEPHSYTTSW